MKLGMLFVLKGKMGWTPVRDLKGGVEREEKAKIE